MNEHVLKLLRDVRQSYWFVPSIMVVAAILLAFLTDWIDTNFDPAFLAKISWMYENEPAGARAVLSAIATSMIGVAGVTFSMTIVSVSFAAAQFGPRLVANFMRDTGNQVTLGTFIATFVYCLLILRTVTDASGPDAAAYVPNISVLTALGLTLASVSVLIYFIHHIPESINVGRITAQIGNQLQQRVHQLFPAQLDTSSDSPTPDADEPLFTGALAVSCSEAGYIQAIDETELLKIAVEHDLIVRVEYRPGNFAIAGSCLARVSGSCNKSTQTSLLACFVFGEERTSAQDALFLVDQLVEILARALSPGVNDPFTAVSCMNWLHRAMASIVNRVPPMKHWYDDDKKLRIILRPLDFEQISDSVFEQILQYVAGDRIAALNAIQVIAELLALAPRDTVKNALLRHAANLHSAGQELLPVASAREALTRRYELTRRFADDPILVNEKRDDEGWLGGNG